MAKNQRLNSTITIGASLERSFRQNVSFIKNGLSSVGDEIKSVEAKQRELGKQRAVLEKQGRSVAELDREYEKLDNQLGRLKRSQERWNRAAAASQRVGASYSRMMTSIGQTSRTAAIGVGVAGGTVFALASQTAVLGDDVAKTADKLGVGITQLQELRYAAERSGVSTGDLDKSLEKLNRNLGEALTGSGPAADALEALGLRAEDLVNLEPEEALGAIADRMIDVETQAERTALATDIFGRSGVGMINMLKDGSDGLSSLREQARRTGYVLSEEAARNAEKFQDTLLDTKLTMLGLRNTVGAALMPVVERSMARLGDWLVSNRGLVADFATALADGLERGIPVIGEVLTGMSDIGGQILPMVGGIADMVGGYENLGKVLAVTFASRTILRIGQFAWSVGSLGVALGGVAFGGGRAAGAIRGIGAALAANPIGLAIAAIAGGALLIYKNWETVGPFFKGLWSDVQGYFGGLGDFVGGVFSGDMARAADGIQAAWGSLKSFWGRIFRGIGDVASYVWTTVIKPVTDALGVTDYLVTAWDAAGRGIDAAVGFIGDKFSWVLPLISPVLAALGSTDGLAAGRESLKNGVGAALQWLGEKFDWILGKIEPVKEAIEWVLGKRQEVRSYLGGDGASVMDGYDGARAGDGPSPMDNARRGIPEGVDTGRTYQFNARGGSYRPGWHVTGERGPELKFESRGGYVASNRALQRMAELADRASQPAMAPSRVVVPGAVGTRQIDRSDTRRRQGALRLPISDERIAQRGPDGRDGSLSSNRATPRVADFAARPVRSAAMPAIGVPGSIDTGQPNLAETRRRQGALRLPISDERIAQRGPDGQDGSLSNNQAMERMAEFAERASQPAAVPARGAEGPTYITINAASASADEVADVIERRRRIKQGAALFDRVGSVGPHGG